MLNYLVCELYVDLCTVGTIWNNYKYNKICCRFTQYNCPVDGWRQHNCAFPFTIYNLISMDNLSISYTNNGYRLTILSNISLINSSVDFIHLMWLTYVINISLTDNRVKDTYLYYNRLILCNLESILTNYMWYYFTNR